jgi:hypothetical protein
MIAYFLSIGRLFVYRYLTRFSSGCIMMAVDGLQEGVRDAARRGLGEGDN